MVPSAPKPGHRRRLWLRRSACRHVLSVLVAGLGAAASHANLRGQQPPAGALAADAGPGATAPLHRQLALADELLQREDPLSALVAYRQSLALQPDVAGAIVGLGRAHLMLGRPQVASSCAAAVLRGPATAADPEAVAAMALLVRAKIRARAFDDAVQTAQRFAAGCAEPTGELLAAQASALFRVQRIEEAERVYRAVLQRDPDNAEAHLRLGSGLLPPTDAGLPEGLLAAVSRLRVGDLSGAVHGLRQILVGTPNHPVAHRLLGEALFQQRYLASMAAQEDCFRQLAASQPLPDVRGLPVAEFVPGYQHLSPARRAVVDRTMALFAGRLSKLVALGAAHDLLLETERTTDDPARAQLRGRRTFDGRVWDDVRGVGGLRAATGIEALDEAAQFGFDTLAHEVAHQVHWYALRPVDRARIKELYLAAKAADRFLDFYAASNESEYFGQGVEAFVSLGKRPGCETTHGHTRFELLRRDPPLHDFIAGIVDHDPLSPAVHRAALLRAAVQVALRCGRPSDAIVAAGMLDPGPERERWLAVARSALLAAQSH